MMLRNWFINTLSIIVLAYLLPGVHVVSLSVAILVALVLGVLNTFVRPVLVFFTIPLTVVTLGFFLLVINVLMVYLTSNLVHGFHVDGFLWALVFSFGLSVVSNILSFLLRKKG